MLQKPQVLSPVKPKRASLVVLSKPAISQLQIELATSLLNDLQTVERSLMEIVGPMFEQLLGGCEVEPGPLLIEVREEGEVTARTKRLYLNGRPMPCRS